jgi:hypothetical protein
MKDYLLLTGQKNDTLKCIQEARLNPLNFEWASQRTDCSDEGYAVSILKYKGSDFYFKFDRIEAGMFVCGVSPGALQLVETLGDIYHEWHEVLDEFRYWLYRLERELAPDLWEQLKEYAPHETLIGTREISNAPFSYSEAENIIGSLNKLQAQIKRNFNLQGEQLAFVKREIEYLKEAAKRQGRKDWMHTAIGVIMTIAVGLALSPEKAKLLWDLLKSCFAGILQLPAP